MPSKTLDSDQLERTHLIRGRTPGLKDARVLDAVRNLSTTPPVSTIVAVGIANERAQVYRVVKLISLLEVVQFTASMNAMGFTRDHTRRGCRRSPYENVFLRQPARTTSATEA